MATNNALLSISEMANYCRTTKDTLYFYERKGILKPALIAENGYRYYDSCNFYLMDMVFSLRDAGASVQEIQALVSDFSAENYLNLYKDKRFALSKKIKDLQILINRMDRSIEATTMGLNSNNTEYPTITYEESEFLIISPIEDSNNPDDIVSCTAKILTRCQQLAVPHDYCINGITTRDKLDVEEYKVNYLFTVSQTAFIRAHDVYIKPEGTYVSMIHTGPFDTAFTTYEKLISYIKANNYKICGNAYERSLIGWLHTIKDCDYKSLISIHIEKSDNTI